MKQNAISDLKLEKYRLGELSSRETKEMDGLLEQDEDLKRRLEDLKTSDAKILEQYKPAFMAGKIEKKLEREENLTSYNKRSFRQMFGVILPLLAGAALAVIFIPVLLINFKFGDLGGETRIKGKTSLMVYRKTATGEEPLKDGDLARKGDILQLAYASGMKKYGVIFSIDGKGNLTWHFPASLQEDTRLQAGKMTLLPESYELDDAPAFERFFFIASDSRLVLSNIVKNASILARTPERSVEKSSELFNNEKVVIITLKKGE